MEQIARKARIPVGFENELGCGAGERTKSVARYRRDVSGDAWELSGATAREAIEQLLAIAPAYRGVEHDGIFVVRPTRTWDDPDNILNRAVRPFSVENIGIEQLVRVMLESATPSLYPAIPAAAIQYTWRPQVLPRRVAENGPRFPPDPRPPAPIQHPVTMTFAGGTLLQALNALAVRQALHWQVGYIGTPGRIRAQVLLSDIDLWPSGGLTSSLTAPLHSPRY